VVPTEEYRGYTIEWQSGNDPSRRATVCYVNVRQDDRDVFQLRMLITNPVAVRRFGPLITAADWTALCQEFAVAWVHGLIDLARFEMGAVYDEQRTTEWDPLFGDQDFSEDDLRYHLLLALRRRRRATVRTSAERPLDVAGIAAVLGIATHEVRAVLGELALEGLAELDDDASFGDSVEDGACSITGDGLVYLRQAQASTAAQPPFVTVDDIDSFTRVRAVSPADVAAVLDRNGLLSVPEAEVKTAICGIIGESAEFRDWGGERSDVFTSRVAYRGRRVHTAMLLKGPAVGPVLYPAGLGKRGDQDMRLFSEPAELLILQFNGRIDSAVHQRLWTLAQNRGMHGERPTVCVIDGTDTARLLRAYGYLP
jgi:hypothetical protein